MRTFVLVLDPGDGSSSNFVTRAEAETFRAAAVTSRKAQPQK